MADAPESPGWRESDSELFIQEGEFFVPERAQQIRTICDAIPKPKDPVTMLELCCGQGLLSAALLERFPSAKVTALDGSDAMRQAATKTCAKHAERFETRPFDLAATDWRQANLYSGPDTPIHAIVSSLAIHHLDDAGKEQLYRDLHTMLAPGGALVIADLIKPTTPEATQIAAAAWDDATRETAQAAGDDDAFARFHAENWNLYSDPDPDPIDQPSTLFDQLKWLEAAGFQGVDVHWMRGGHAIFGGRKM